MLTKDEWKKHAEIAAAHKHGENNVGFYVWRRRLAGPWGVVLAVVVFAGVVRWLWKNISLPDMGTGTGGLPIVFWVFMVALIIATGVAFRPARTFRTFSATMVRAAVIGLLWLGFITYAITVIV